MIFLSGSMSLTTPDGHAEVFKPGEVALIPKGIDVKMKADSVRIYFVSFDRDQAKPATAGQ